MPRRREAPARCHDWSALAAVCAVLLGSAQPAAAYCRASVETRPLGPCEEDPDVPLLHWTRGCAQYAFHRELFSRIPRLSEEQIRADYDDAFAQYSAVDCGRRPFTAVQLQAPASSDRAEFQWDVQNESVMAVRSADEWSELGYDERAIALTLLYFDPDDGEIFDVDMELNDGAGQFIHCQDECSAGEVDLPSTLAHEAGHYLGLGHSTVPGSTMLARADMSIERRTLADDDREGYCTLDLPEPELDAHDEPRCDTPVFARFPTEPKAMDMKPVPDCAALPEGAHGRHPGALLALSAIACWLLRRLRATPVIKQASKPARAARRSRAVVPTRG